MKYLTPELYLRLQDLSSDQAMDAAEAAWRRAALRYQRRLRRLRPSLPRGLRSLQENYHLHDAEVLFMGKQRRALVLVVRLDTPPRELLVLRYRLKEEAALTTTLLPQHDGPVQWMYDEIDRSETNPPGFRHSILFSNGWEMTLCVTAVTIQHVEALYPVPGTMLLPVATQPVPKSA